MPHLPDDIAQIELPTPFDMGGVNIWLLKGEIPTLIDFGIDWRDGFERLETLLADAGYALTDIAQVLCTHGHEDHIGLTKRFVERHEVPVYLHRDDHFKMTDNRAGPPWMRWAEYLRELYRVSGMPNEIVEPIFSMGEEDYHRAMGIGYGSYAHPLPLEDGQRIPAGDRMLTVVTTPGHCPGQVVFLEESEGILFSGDQVLDKISPNPVIEYHTGERYLALVEYVRSLRRVETLDFGGTCPGHGSFIPDTPRVLREYFKLLEVRLDMAYKLVRREMRTAYDVTSHVYKHAKGWAVLPAFNAGIGLLDVLQDRGMVAQLPGEDGLVYWRAVEELP